MKISKRDRNLLVFLGFLVVFALYYFLLMNPTEQKIKTLEFELDDWQSRKAAVDVKINTEKSIDNNITNAEAEIATSVQNYYEQVTQEEIVATLASYSIDANLVLSEMQFTGNTSTNDSIVSYQATVGFGGTYSDLLSYIRALRNHEKKIEMRGMHINNSITDGLTGELTFEFSSIPKAQKYIVAANKYIAEAENTRDIIPGPFRPYLAFDTVSATDQPLVEYPTDTEEIDYENYRPKTQVYGFEEGDFFFVANSEDIEGTLKRSLTKVAGGYSAELDVNFETARPHSEANIVFDQQKVMLNKQVDYLGLWIYAYEASNHAIGVNIIDAKGKEYKVELASQVDWTQWKEVEVQMPVEMSYPCMIQRIYVEGVGYDQKLTGKYLFDQLQVSYPLQ